MAELKKKSNQILQKFNMKNKFFQKNQLLNKKGLNKLKAKMR